MRKLCLRVVALSVVFLTSCATMTQMASLMNCKYSIKSVADPRIVGVGITDINKLSVNTGLKVTAGLLAGSLPMSVTVNVGVQNPNASVAQMAGLDWMLFFEGTNMLSGSTQQQIYIPANGGSSVIPFTVEMDLAQIFKNKSREEIMKFANGLMNVGDNTSKVSLKIRPAISFGGQVIKTSYITLSKVV